MRYIGNKESVIGTISSILEKHNIVGNTFFDFFSGTSSVAKFYKKENYKIYSSDMMHFSYCLQKAYIENNSMPTFEKIIPKLPFLKDKDIPFSLFEEEKPLNRIIKYLNSINGVEGFIYINYSPEGSCDIDIPRMYFSTENAKKIDAIRIEIENWYSQKLLLDNEYYILLAVLLESVSLYSNISGVYGAFNKRWDARALKEFRLREIELIYNEKNNLSYNEDSLNLLDKISDIDILYLDPPYNSRQYAPNYHILETISRYDNPDIKGVTGLRDYKNQKSKFCNKKTAYCELENILKKAKAKYIVLSYNNEGIMNDETIKKIFMKYGELIFENFSYKRFNSNQKGNQFVKEQLYILIKGKF
ncbi:MAG: DNA adenine methylase [Alphaproteobacteria bacterium]